MPAVWFDVGDKKASGVREADREKKEKKATGHPQRKKENAEASEDKELLIPTLSVMEIIFESAQ